MILVTLVYTLLSVSKLFFVGSVIWFIFDNLRYVSCLYNFSYLILLCSICRSRILWRPGTT